MFLEAKASYEQKLEEQGHEVTAEALSVFYKDFLDKSYERQMEYNRTWWRLNLSMLYPGCKAAIRRLLRKNEPLPTVSRVSYWDKSFES
ncbi:hypothetical protein BCR43DRAFT_435023 [Syncephalastrum racemosum]|uniref:Uncharacterized protein n=1 Tax=Syncephalastrum racemosum TaxID=13706 RepID=A0A1X2HN21_SYNRA|nr:hypothetical protein BCR43DRAFT_435023 [Syncephalastrum racemosum]